MCVSEEEREGERECVCVIERERVCVFERESVCMWGRMREKESERERECVYVRKKEKERDRQTLFVMYVLFLVQRYALCFV